jgi:preprotein translocase subunit SecF
MEFSHRKCLYAATLVAAVAILSITFFGLFGRRSIIGFALAVLLGALIGRWIR